MLVHIQILRFIAAISVIAFHALGVAPDGFKVAESPISFVLSYGGRGVDLFFVISGFIIFYATHDASLTPAGFLRRRVERIVPLYFFVIFTVTVLAMTLPATFGAPDWYTPRHVLKSLAFVGFHGWRNAGRLCRLVARIRDVFLSRRGVADGGNARALA